jgi:hypothetical protein
MCSSTLATALHVDQRALLTPSSQAVADLQRRHGLRRASRRRRRRRRPAPAAVGADAGLAGVAVLGGDGALDRGVEVGVVEDDEGRVAAELQRELLHVSAHCCISTADLGGAGEGQLAHDRVGGHLAADLAGAAGDDAEHALGGNAGALGQHASASAENGVCGRPA